MDEILEAERRDNIVKMFLEIANGDMLTNRDGLQIIDILVNACKRARATAYEDMMAKLLRGDEEE